VSAPAAIPVNGCPSPRPLGWPEPLAPDAFHGLAGTVAKAIEPHTEADCAALLVQFLGVCGNIVGRDPYFVADGARHGLNIYLAVVGSSAKARKGTSFARLKELVLPLEPKWRSRVLSGLSSSEGLVHAVRDSDEQDEDTGVADKRLFVVESEFSKVLRVMGRDGNTLSQVLRQAWDGECLQTMTKNNPQRATGAHVSVVGHITVEELQETLTSVEISNGFANRFLWACARRSKLLPDSGRVPKSEHEELQAKLQDVFAFWHTFGECEFQRDTGAAMFWRELYCGELSQEAPGRLGAVTARSEAQVMRLACTYALLDKSPEVRLEHLRAALAVWRYCRNSARFLFDCLHPHAERLLSALRAAPAGLAKTKLYAVLGRNCDKREVESALAQLERHGLADQEQQATPGRSAEIWKAVGPC
jgi:hypothetical protein